MVGCIATALIVCAPVSLGGSGVPRPPHLAVATVPKHEQGCQIFEISTRAPAGITVTPVPTSSCGGVGIVLAANHEAAYNSATGLVRLSIALANQGTRRLKAPARLYAWPESTSVLVPATRAARVSFANQDSLMGNAAGPLARARVWRYDNLLASTGTTQILGLGDTTAARFVDIVVRAPVRTFRITLHARVERAGTLVTAQAADTIPRWFWDDSIWSRSPGGTLWVPDVVFIQFRPTATLRERQQAVDDVGGDVFGGINRVPGDEGFYYVRVPHAETDSALFAVIAHLISLPAVRYADFEAALTPSHRKPIESGTRKRAGSTVTAQSPDTVPAWYWADSNWVLTEPGGPRYVPNAISVTFKPNASLHDRQMAIDLVGGEVIGGMRMTGGAEGAYILRLISVTTKEQLLNVRSILMGLPQVDRVALQMEMSPSYRRPRDDTLSWAQWSLSRA